MRASNPLPLGPPQASRVRTTLSLGVVRNRPGMGLNSPLLQVVGVRPENRATISSREGYAGLGLGVGVGATSAVGGAGVAGVAAPAGVGGPPGALRGRCAGRQRRGGEATEKSTPPYGDRGLDHGQIVRPAGSRWAHLSVPI